MSEVPTSTPPTQDEDAIKTRMEEMEKEAAKLRELQNNLQIEADLLKQEKSHIDARSVYVGNVDYGSTPEELQKHFNECGVINRVTILLDKFTGHPKGFAYIEFGTEDCIAKALELDNSLFRDRNLKVTAKRTNVPGFGFRGGRGRARGRGRGRVFRGRGRGRFVPY